jgi:hypothetical protein
MREAALGALACAAPAGSPCRATKGKVAVQHHTARFRLVPSPTKALSVPTPPVREPRFDLGGAAVTGERRSRTSRPHPHRLCRSPPSASWSNDLLATLKAGTEPGSRLHFQRAVVNRKAQSCTASTR